MLKLVMVGEQHGIGGDSKNLPKIGPAIAKLRQGNGNVRLLVEGEFFSANKKAPIGAN